MKSFFPQACVHKRFWALAFCCAFGWKCTERDGHSFCGTRQSIRGVYSMAHHPRASAIAQINVGVPASLKQKVHEAASIDFRSVTDVVAKLLHEYVRDHPSSKRKATA
jgi:hypothetical protein